MNDVKVKTAELPVIDISSLYTGEEDAFFVVGKKIVRACETFGFFYLSGYDIPKEKIDFWLRLSKRYFDKPIEFKDKNSIEYSDRFQGYEPQTSAESKEAYVLGPERAQDDPLVLAGEKYHGANVWPSEGAGLDGWRIAMIDQMQSMLELARLINRALAVGLGVPRDYFDKGSDDPMYALRLLHYVPQSDERHGIADHTDWGALSLLIQGDVPGLEVLMPDGTWSLAVPIENTMIVNVGELVARWTNNRLKATRHRVRNLSGVDRYSMAFFLDMNHDAVIKPIETCVSNDNPAQYEPIIIRDFIDLMHKRDYS